MSLLESPSTSADFITMEADYGAHNYHPLPVVLKKEKAYRYGMSKAKYTMIF